MKITNVKIYDLEESVIASGLPMQTSYNELVSCDDADALFFGGAEYAKDNPHFKRACKLAANPTGSGHNNFLSGIVVSANVTATVKWWEQFQRYHFKQIISSQSTMHRLRKMIKEGKFGFNPLTHNKIITSFIALVFDEGLTDEELAYSCPMGLELTARITTNYLQLKTMYNQRKNHKLTEWRDFCAFIETLRYAKEFITGENGEDKTNE